MFNIRNLRNKFSDLEVLAASDNFHVIGIVSESWMNTENKDFLAEYNSPNYSMFSCEWQDKKKLRCFGLHKKQSQLGLANKIDFFFTLKVYWLREDKDK